MWCAKRHAGGIDQARCHCLNLTTQGVPPPQSLYCPRKAANQRLLSHPQSASPVRLLHQVPKGGLLVAQWEDAHKPRVIHLERPGQLRHAQPAAEQKRAACVSL